MQAELVERAIRGDRDAFASLAAQSIDRCYALAYRILRDPHRAQDATQQALIGVWRDLPTLRDPERFAKLLPAGKVLVAGGRSVIDGTFRPQASAELYDPGSGN